MTESRPHNPFHWYLGKAVTLQGRSYVVERSEIVGRELSFLLRDEISGNTRRLAPLELLSLEASEYLEEPITGAIKGARRMT